MPAIGNSHIVGAEDTRQSIQSFNSHSIKPQNIRNTQPYRLAYALANQLWGQHRPDAGRCALL